MDKTLVTRYLAGAPIPGQAMVGLSRADLLAQPVPGTWSIQQIVIHLMDSDLIASDRMKRVIAEDNPTIIGYNETAFSQKLCYDLQDATVAAEIFRLNRQQTAVILQNVPDAAWSRTGTHNERGALSLAELVEIYVNHLDHHMKFLQHKRQLLGKP